MGGSEKLRAKFRVTEVAHVEVTKQVDSRLVAGVGGRVMMIPVMSGSEENKRFFAATPGGAITLQIVDEEVLASMRVGREFYVDFTPAP
jgi:hypothetical protein